MRDKKQMVNTVYIGYDEKEDTAYEVLKFSLERIATKPIRVVPIKKNLINRMGIYTRKSNVIGEQHYDEIDGKPFSTEFSFSRFLVPALNMYQGYALYMDCDMYIRADVNELFDYVEILTILYGVLNISMPQKKELKWMVKNSNHILEKIGLAL